LRDDDVKRRKEALRYGGLAKIHHRSSFYARRPGTARGDAKSLTATSTPSKTGRRPVAARNQIQKAK
jgi:hypothetical protein